MHIWFGLLWILSLTLQILSHFLILSHFTYTKHFKNYIYFISFWISLYLSLSYAYVHKIPQNLHLFWILSLSVIHTSTCTKCIKIYICFPFFELSLSLSYIHKQYTSKCIFILFCFAFSLSYTHIHAHTSFECLYRVLIALFQLLDIWIWCKFINKR